MEDRAFEKPIVIKRINQFVREVRHNGNKIGITPRQLIIDYDNTCNFSCKFCYELQDRKYNGTHLSIQELSDIADQAYDMGIWEVIFQGGEMLCLFDDFIKILDAFKPERFRMVLVTNGYLLTEERARILKEHGMDCVGISISGMDSAKHNADRGGCRDAHQKALSALDNVQQAGMTPWAQVVFGHHNSHSKDLFDLLDYLKEKSYATYFILAMPYGIYKDDCLDANDIRIFNNIRHEYKTSFDTWDFYDSKRERITGCWAGNRLFITPKGDVLPCPFINVSLGNVHEKQLKDIYDFGMTIKWFKENSPVCLSAQNRQFRRKYLDGLSTSMFHPEDAHNIFKEDIINE